MTKMHARTIKRSKEQRRIDRREDKTQRKRDRLAAAKETPCPRASN
jgi:hypothetical protein